MRSEGFPPPHYLLGPIPLSGPKNGFVVPVQQIAKRAEEIVNIFNNRCVTATGIQNIGPQVPAGGHPGGPRRASITPYRLMHGVGGLGVPGRWDWVARRTGDVE